MILQHLIGEYIQITTKETIMTGCAKPMGYCTEVDEDFIVIEAQQNAQIQLPGIRKFSKPFYVVPIEDIRGIAGLDPETLQHHTTSSEKSHCDVEYTHKPHIPQMPVDTFEEVDFNTPLPSYDYTECDNQLPESYIADNLILK